MTKISPDALFVFLLTMAIFAAQGLTLQTTNDHRQVKEQGWEYRAAGSRLPDCSRACQGCLPCKRVVISLECSLAESCPIVYRCSCHGRFYHIPSSH